MDDDRQLLRRFVDDHSQAAFAALTARYLSLVYSTCRRELGDADLAEDVTQAVFLILARKAPSLRREVVLSGWLFQTARFAARNARLQETRRKATEGKATEGKATETVREQQMETDNAAWTDIEPLLNQSLAGLREAERECVLLRFFQGMSFAEAGAALGLSEEAARKRVTRALEKMRQFFVKNGVIIPSTAIAVLLTAHAAKAAPAGLAPAVAQSTAGILAGHTTTAALTGSHVYQLSEGVIKAMKIVQLKAAVGIAAVVLGASAYAIARGTAAQPLPKPGHLFQQIPGKAFTAVQIATRCQAAYHALQTYQGTTVSTSQTTTGSDKTVSEQHISANIQYVQPNRIAVEGTDVTGGAAAYVTDGVSVAEKSLLTQHIWGRAQSINMPVSVVGGSMISSGTTIPSFLLEACPSNPFSDFNTISPDVREDAVDGQKCFILMTTTGNSMGRGSRELYVDEKTFLLRRVVIDERNTVFGNIHAHIEQQFTNERLNQPVPESAFALPPV